MASTNIEYVTMLQQIDLFQNIPLEIMVKIAPQIEMKKIRKNTLVCKKGDSASEMFILLAGSILFYDEVYGAVKELGGIEKNDQQLHQQNKTNANKYPFFGETALYGSSTFQRTAFAKAMVDSVLLSIPSNIIDSMFEYSDDFIKSVKEQSKKNLARSAAMKSKARNAFVTIYLKHEER
jgi:signal-transduction protein with cAMP-binding, CBS, and nucleotidyltransferase domain